MHRFRIAMLVAITALIALTAAANAHDLVLVPEPNKTLTIRYGHAGDWLAVDSMRLLELDVYSSDRPGRNVRAQAKQRGIDLVAAGIADQRATLAAARYDNGAWAAIIGADGKPDFRNASRLMLPAATSTLWSLKFAKALFPSAGDPELFKRELGHWLEIIPQTNPAVLKPGDTLPVLVRFDGKPATAVGVELGDLLTKVDEDKIVRYTTDASGIARVPIRKRGLQLLAVDMERPNDGSLGEAATKLGVDKLLIIATYVFRL